MSYAKNNYTPCDGEDGICPFNAQYSEDCRRNCGLGVDEDVVPYEEEFEDDIFTPSPEDYKEWCDASCGRC